MSRSDFLHAGHKKDFFIADLVSERPEFIELPIRTYHLTGQLTPILAY
jgi:hypothetical protein